MKRHSLICALILLIFPMIVIAQRNFNPQRRPIIINSGDSIIFAYIQTKEHTYSPINNRTYYWFYAENIHWNLGGYSGNLLHNNYVIYNKEKNMIESGSFNNGLKTGCWKRWYPDGELQSIINWKDGLLDGMSLSYSRNGLIYESIEYKDGKKNGAQVHFENDTLVKIVYRKGIMVKKIPLLKSQRQKVSQPGDTTGIDKKIKIQPFKFIKKENN
jgi:hypothetical protein